jgi:hypothetical protein
MPLLQSLSTLGSLREGLLWSASERLRPAELAVTDATVSMSLAAAIVVVVAWAAVPLGAGAWRTVTRDA